MLLKGSAQLVAVFRVDIVHVLAVDIGHVFDSMLDMLLFTHGKPPVMPVTGDVPGEDARRLDALGVVALILDAIHTRHIPLVRASTLDVALKLLLEAFQVFKRNLAWTPK